MVPSPAASLLDHIWSGALYCCFITGPYLELRPLPCFFIGPYLEWCPLLLLLYWTISGVVPSPSASLLDHIRINWAQPVTSGILCSDLSDHCPTLLFWPHQMANVDQNIQYSYGCYDQVNIIKSSDKFTTLDWPCLCSRDLNNKVSYYVTVLDQLYCSSSPVKAKHVSFKHVGKPLFSP